MQPSMQEADAPMSHFHSVKIDYTPFTATCSYHDLKVILIESDLVGLKS